jgi:hypothetical protein
MSDRGFALYAGVSIEDELIDAVTEINGDPVYMFGEAIEYFEALNIIKKGYCVVDEVSGRYKFFDGANWMEG